MKIAVYPGSFDPITNGHLDVLYRSSKVFDEVVVLVAENPEKKYIFSSTERVKMIQEAIKGFDNISVDKTSGLTVEYAKEIGACCLIRGLRAVTDFEYELKLAAANRFVDKNIDEVFFMASPEHSFISSSMVNELYYSGVDISKLVPSSVVKMYQEKK